MSRPGNREKKTASARNSYRRNKHKHVGKNREAWKAWAAKPGSQDKRRAMNRDYRARHNPKIRCQETAWRQKRPLYYAVKRARLVATKLGLPFDLDDRKLERPKFCPVLGLELRYGPGYSVSDRSPSLDRVVPSVGYVHGNVRIISHRANTIKSNATVEELRRVADDLERILNGPGGGAAERTL